MHSRNKFIRFVFSILICQAAGFIGSFFTRNSIQTWYKTIQKPAFTPPNWVFAPTWITLFFLMGVSLFIFWEKGLSSKKPLKEGFFWFGIQLLLNTLWSVIFFGLRSPSAAFAEIVLLWTAILLTILKFRKISTSAAVLLLPYIYWVSFALVLNFAIFQLN